MSNLLVLPTVRDPQVGPPVQSVAVITDDLGRVFFDNPRLPDVWVLPAAWVGAGMTPREALAGAGIGVDYGPGRLLGIWKAIHAPDLMVGYVFSSQSGPGIPLPVGLCPLNIDPAHLAIATMAAGGQPLPDLLDVPSAADHVAWLREGETPPNFAASRANMLAREMGFSDQLMAATPQSIFGQVEALIASGELPRARSTLSRIVADDSLDPLTRLKGALRLEEIESMDGAFPHAWRQVSLSSGRRGRYLDVVFSHLAFASARRGRRREALAYLRRALGVCENQARRAAIRYALTVGSGRLLSVSA